MSFEDKLREAINTLNEASHLTDCVWCQQEVGKVSKLIELILEATPYAKKVVKIHTEMAHLGAEIKRDVAKV